MMALRGSVSCMMVSGLALMAALSASPAAMAQANAATLAPAPPVPSNASRFDPSIPTFSPRLQQFGTRARFDGWLANTCERFVSDARAAGYVQVFSSEAAAIRDLAQRISAEAEREYRPTMSEAEQEALLQRLIARYARDLRLIILQATEVDIGENIKPGENRIVSPPRACYPYFGVSAGESLGGVNATLLAEEVAVDAASAAVDAAAAATDAAADSSSPPPPPAPPPEALPPPPPLVERAVDVQNPVARLLEPNSVTVSATTTGPTIGESVTNVQVATVDEGGIVKRAGPFILTLMDGRIFSVDTRNGAMALVDRVNVYDRPDEDVWIDEMLVDDDHVIVTQFNYAEAGGQSELAVFQINMETGQLTLKGQFIIQSNDYFSGENYASRIAGGNLVFTTFADLAQVLDEKNIPQIQRRVGDQISAASPLFRVEDIYMPVRPDHEGSIGIITVCPLNDGNAQSGQTPLLSGTCRATALMATNSAETYVTPTDLYLWTGYGDNFGNSTSFGSLSSSDASGFSAADAAAAAAGVAVGIGDNQTAPAICPPGLSPGRAGVIYRIPVDGSPMTIAATSGAPLNQFSFHVQNDQMHMVNTRALRDCRTSLDANDTAAAQRALLQMPLTSFSQELEAAPTLNLTELPHSAGFWWNNRFTRDWLILSSSRGHFFDGRQAGRAPAASWAIPLATPAQPHRLPVTHPVSRIEPVDDGVVVIGQAPDRDLMVSFVPLRPGQLKLADEVSLFGRRQSESRSQAFNSAPISDGGAIMGLPTMPMAPSRQRNVRGLRPASDMSFIRLTADDQLVPAGDVARQRDRPARGYVCEVSCIDWYGNSRAIFTGGRLFALMGTELVEVRLDGNRIAELGRLDMTQPLNR